MSGSRRPRRRPVSSSPGTTSVTARDWRREFRPQPVAFRLMTAEASATRAPLHQSGVNDPIGRLHPPVFQYLAQFDTIEMQEAGEAALHSVIAACASAASNSSAGRWPVGISLVSIRLEGRPEPDAPASVILPFVSNRSTCRPSYGKLFKPADHRLARDAEEMRQRNDVAPRRSVDAAVTY